MSTAPYDTLKTLCRRPVMTENRHSSTPVALTARLSAHRTARRKKDNSGEFNCLSWGFSHGEKGCEGFCRGLWCSLRALLHCGLRVRSVGALGQHS